MSGFSVAELEAVFRQPGLGVRLLDLPLRMAESGRNGHFAVDQRRIGREDQVGHAGHRLHAVDRRPGLLQQSPQVLPLGHRRRVIGPLAAVHPRIDLVLDAVMVRRAHQDAGRHRPDPIRKTQNPKFEARNPKQIRNSNEKKEKKSKTRGFELLNFALNLFRISTFEFRILDLPSLRLRSFQRRQFLHQGPQERSHVGN